MEKKKLLFGIKTKCAAWFAIGLGVSLCLSGCAGDLPDLSDKQLQQAGEYAAMVLMKYDSQNRRRLMSEEEMKAEQEKREAWKAAAEFAKNADEESGQSGSGDTGEPDMSRYGVLEACYQFPEGVSIAFSKYSVADSYEQENSFLSVEATKGKKLLILEFNLRNSGSQKAAIDLLKTGMKYWITVNGNYTRTQLTTLLDNDLATFKDYLEPDQTIKSVLLFEIDPGTDIDSLTMKLKSESIESTILIK